MSFEHIISTIYQKNKELAEVNSLQFSNIFENNEDFRKSFYKYFCISGASLVIADSLEKKVVLLQEEVEDAKGFPILKVPVYPKENPKNLFISHSEISGTEYNFLVNRIFQTQRKFQGLKDHEDEVTFTDVPEFLDMLPTLEELERGNKKYSHNLIPKHQLVYGFVLWRLFTWMSHKNSIDKTQLSILKLGKNDFTIQSRLPNSAKYFSQSFLNTNYSNKELPEFSILDMDLKTNWSTYDNSFYVWNKLRKEIDKVKKEFQDELDIINKILDDETFNNLKNNIQYNGASNKLDFSVVKAILNHFLTHNPTSKTNTLERNLEILHEQIPLIISYYYFSLIDERVKSHFVFSIWHSQYHPIEYINKQGQLIKHTSILNCVVSLDEELNEDKQVQLISAFKLLTESVINSVFVERLIRAEQRKDIYQFQRNILLSNSEQKRGVFLLGSNEERITFLAQQSRAINLIRALHEFKIIDSDSTIAIVGGGLSGVTAAVAAHIIGVKFITIIEKSTKLLNFQTGAKHRYIHPYIYDWPSTIYQKEEAEVPFLKWTADYADKVLEQVRKGFSLYKEQNKVNNIKIELNTDVKEIRKDTNGFLIPLGKDNNLRCNIVIMAVGQGPEKNKFTKIVQKGYWEPDVLETKFARNMRILIGGSGDGALVDLIRAKLKDDSGKAIKHKDIFELTTLKSFRSLGQKMLLIDKKYLANLYLQKNPKDLFSLYYEKLFSDSDLKDAILHLRKYYRNETEILHCNKSECLKFNTSLLNRLIVFLLHCDKDNSSVSFDKLEVNNCEKSRHRYKVSFDLNNRHIDYFDHVFFRFGPDVDYLKPFDLGTINKTEQIFKLNLTNYISLDTSQWYKELMTK